MLSELQSVSCLCQESEVASELAYLEIKLKFLVNLVLWGGLNVLKH